MGRQDFPFSYAKESDLRLQAPLTIVASREQLDSLRASEGFGLLGDATLVELELSEDFPERVKVAAGILVVQADPAVQESMDRLTRISESRPQMPRIVALADADIRVVRTLLHQGVSDVVGLPLAAEEVLQAALAAKVERRADDKPAVKKAPVVAVVRALGGNGATTIATHVAHELGEADTSGRGVCLMDLDIQYGSVCSVLNLKPRRNITDLLEAVDKMDGALMKSVAVKHSDELSVIAAPTQILPLEEVDADDLLRVIDLAREEYAAVVLDLPSNWTSWNLSAVVGADRVLMVVDLSLQSLHQAKRRLDLFASVGLDPKKISIVANKVENKLFKTIGLDDVARTLGHDVMAGIHLDEEVVPVAQDQGLFAEQIKKRSKFVKDIGKLSDDLYDWLGMGGVQ